MHEPDDSLVHAPGNHWRETSATEDSDRDGGPVLYEGDRGELPLDARRLLVHLLSGPSLDAQRHNKLWPSLLRYRDVVQSRLADLFLELVLDAEAGVAFVRQADTGELDTPVLLRRSPLTFLDSVLLLYLRQALADADLRGERAVVSAAELLDQLQLYEQSLNTDHAGFAKRCQAAIEKAKKNSLLTAIRHNEGRFEISPTLKLLFGAEQVAALTRIYKHTREGVTGAVPGDRSDIQPTDDEAQS